MPIEISKVTNARVYINGTDFIAKAEEVDLPKVKFKTTETKGLALIGETDLPTILDKMEARIKFNSVYPEFVAIASNPFKTVSVIVKSPAAIYTQEGVQFKPLKAELRGTFVEFDTGKMKKGDNAEAEARMSVYYYKLEYDGREVYEVDILNNILKIEGKDVLADYRNAMGG